jgi:capsular polysaccharide biosynthesis protein
MNESEKVADKLKENRGSESDSQNYAAENTNIKDDDEIDLYELVMVLARRWKLILGIFIAGVVVSAAVSLFLLKPVYKSSFLIKINKDIIKNNNRVNINRNSSQEFQIFTRYIDSINYDIIKHHYGLISKRLGITANLSKHISSISASQINNSNLVKITIYFYKTKGIRDIASGIFKGINGFKYFAILRDKNKKYLQVKQAVLLKTLDAINYIINNMSKFIINAAGGNGKFLLMYAHPNSFINKIYNLKIKIYDVNYDLKHHLYLPFSLVSKPIAPGVPFKPNKKLIVAVSGISALFFGVFLAFFLEFIKNNKSRHKAIYDDKKAGK